MATFYIVCLLITILVGGLFTWKQWMDVRRISQESKRGSEQMRRLNDPMVAYLDTLQGKPYSEEGFRQFMREQYGEEQLQRYLLELQFAHAMIGVRRKR